MDEPRASVPGGREPVPGRERLLRRLRVQRLVGIPQRRLRQPDEERHARQQEQQQIHAPAGLTAGRAQRGQPFAGRGPRHATPVARRPAGALEDQRPEPHRRQPARAKGPHRVARRADDGLLMHVERRVDERREGGARMVEGEESMQRGFLHLVDHLRPRRPVDVDRRRARGAERGRGLERDGHEARGPGHGRKARERAPGLLRPDDRRERHEVVAHERPIELRARPRRDRPGRGSSGVRARAARTPSPRRTARPDDRRPAGRRARASGSAGRDTAKPRSRAAASHSASVGAGPR